MEGKTIYHFRSESKTWLELEKVEQMKFEPDWGFEF